MSAQFVAKIKELEQKVEILAQSQNMALDGFRLVSEKLKALENRVSGLESRKLGSENAFDNRRDRAAGKAGQ